MVNIINECGYFESRDHDNGRPYLSLVSECPLNWPVPDPSVLDTGECPPIFKGQGLPRACPGFNQGDAPTGAKVIFLSLILLLDCATTEGFFHCTAHICRSETSCLTTMG